MRVGITRKHHLAPAALTLPYGLPLFWFRRIHASSVRRFLNSSNLFLEFCYARGVAEWSFFTNHARTLICIARDPGIRLRDLAVALDVTERSVYGIVTDLVEAGYVFKEKDGRRNRYRVEAQLPLPELIGRDRTIGDVLGLLVDADSTRRPTTKESHVP